MPLAVTVPGARIVSPTKVAAISEQIANTKTGATESQNEFIPKIAHTNAKKEDTVAKLKAEYEEKLSKIKAEAKEINVIFVHGELVEDSLEMLQNSLSDYRRDCPLTFHATNTM